VLEHLASGTTFQVIGGNVDPPVAGSVPNVTWCQVRLASGEQGYVATQDLSLKLTVPGVEQTFTGTFSGRPDNTTEGFEIAEVKQDGTNQLLHVWSPDTDPNGLEFAIFQTLGKNAKFKATIVNPSGFPETIVHVTGIMATSGGAPVEIVGATDDDPTKGFQSWIVKHADGTTATVPMSDVVIGSTIGITGALSNP